MNASEVPLYFDTSALLPYYREEVLSEQVETLLQTQTNAIFISHLTEVEVFSALARWQRMEELGTEEIKYIQIQFETHLAENYYIVHPVSEPIFKQAKQWLSIRRTALRTLDALHLSCACNIGAKLVSADDKLIQAAKFFAVNHQYLSVPSPP